MRCPALPASVLRSVHALTMCRPSGPADKGFGVGHTRATQTKGIWLWAAPQEAQAPGGGPLSVIYVDTEGFESTGKSDAYDDRIFALSALLSSVLMCGPRPCARGLASAASV